MADDMGWSRFYEEADYDRLAYLAGETMVDYAEAFLESIGVPDSFASVGCGPAVVEFALADAYSETDFSCYDVAPQVVEDNRALARQEGLANLSFDVARLPAIDLGRQFGVVYCVATLYFVADVESALQSLYRHVEPGGYLVFDYPDAALREWVREQEERKREMFGHVDDGVNVRSRTAIESQFDEELQDYWAVAPSIEDEGRSDLVYLQRE